MIFFTGNNNRYARPLLLFTVFAVGLYVFVFACIKAATLPLTHDESLSYLQYVPMPVTDITGYVNTYGLPNNHILNTLLMKLSEQLAGNGTLSLRAPNLVAMLFYLYFGYQLLRRTGSYVLTAAGFILLAGNLFINDFFSLARGYGLASALLLGAIFFLFEYRETPSRKKLLLFFILCGLSVLANFTLLHVSLTLVLLCFIIRMMQREKNSMAGFFKAGWPALLFLIIMGGILYEPFRTIIKWKTTFGGTDNFWKNSVAPLITDSIYTIHCFERLPYVSIIIVLILVFVVSASVVSLVKRKNAEMVALAFLLLFPVLIFYLQHWILGTEFPASRTVQYQYPLLILGFIFAIGIFTRQQKRWQWTALFPALVVIIHFSLHRNSDFVPEWRYDSSNKKILDELDKQHETGSTTGTKLFINWLFEPGLQYEQKRRQYRWLTIDRIPPDSTPAGYYYVTANDTSTMSRKGGRLFSKYPVSNSYLYYISP